MIIQDPREDNQNYQLAATKIERNISTIVEKPIGAIPETRLRALASLPPDQQRKAYLKGLDDVSEVTLRSPEYWQDTVWDTPHY